MPHTTPAVRAEIARSAEASGAACDRYTAHRTEALKKPLNAKPCGLDKLQAMLAFNAEASSGAEGRHGCLVVGSAAERSRTMVDNDEALLSQVTVFEDRRYDAMVRGDAASLAGMFDKGLIYTHSSGVRQDAADYLRGLAAGADVYRKIEHGIDRTVRFANSVLVYGWQRMTVETGGATHELDNLSLVVLSRPAGRWALAAYVSTPRDHAGKRAAAGH